MKRLALCLVLICGCDEPPPIKQPEGETWIMNLAFDRKLTEPELQKILEPVWSKAVCPHTNYPLLVGKNGSTTAMVLVWDVTNSLDPKGFVHRVACLPHVKIARINGITARAPVHLANIE